MTAEVAQRLADLQAQVTGLRIAVAALAAVAVLLLVAALAIWSYLRRIYLLQRSQAHHVEAVGTYAHHQIVQQLAREQRRRARAESARPAQH